MGAAPMLYAYDGQPRADLAALEDLLMRVGRLGDDLPQVTSLELTLACTEEACVAVGSSARVTFDVSDDAPRRLKRGPYQRRTVRPFADLFERSRRIAASWEAQHVRYRPRAVRPEGLLCSGGAELDPAAHDAGARAAPGSPARTAMTCSGDPGSAGTPARGAALSAGRPGRRPG